MTINKDDMKCRCCGKYFQTKESIKMLKMIDRQMKNIISINCGYRCKKHNAEVGGKKNSEHLRGNAFDIVVLDPKIIYHLFEVGVIRGLGVYSWGFHVDCRKGIKAKW